MTENIPVKGKAICITGNPLVSLQTIEKSGETYHYREMVEFALSRYDKVYFVSNDAKNYALSDCERFVHVPIKPISGPRSLSAAWYLIRGGFKIGKIARECDLIRADGSGAELQAAIGSFLSHKPLVISYRADSLYSVKANSKTLTDRINYGLFYLITKLSLLHAAEVITLTEMLSRKAEKLGVKSHRIKCIPTPVDTRAFDPSVSRKTIREKFNLHGTVLLYVGRIRPEKRVGNAISALKLVRDAGEDARLLIVGAGPYEDEEKKITDLTKELGLTDYVIRAGAVKHAELPEYYAAGDIFVLPSIMEGLPNALLEAMAMAKPVAATNADGTKEVITGGVNGLLSPVDDVKGLAENIVWLIRERSLALKLGVEARRTIMEKYSYDVVYKKFKKIIDRDIIMISR